MTVGEKLVKLYHSTPSRSAEPARAVQDNTSAPGEP
jgi:hypothetical protein